jgi:hypothetical protein
MPRRRDLDTSHSAAPGVILILASTLLGIVASITWAAVPARAQTTEVVSLQDTTASLPPTEVARVTLPVTPTETTDISEVTVSIVRLRHDEVELALPTGLEAAIEPQIPALVLTVPPDLLPDEGRYDLLLALQSSSARQLATITLTRPAGLVTGPATVTVQRTTSFGPFGGRDTTPQLRLTTSGNTRLLGLTATQVEADDPQVTVDDDGRLPVPPNHTLTLPYQIAGASEPGTVTRTVQLSSPQLSSTVPVAFTIITRRTPWLIAVALVGGVLLGLLLRRLLPALTNWRTTQLERRDLDDQLATWHTEYHDSDFRDEIAQQRGRLRAASFRKLAGVIAEVRTNATQQLQDLRSSLKTQDDRYRAASKVFHREWHLPSDEPTDDRPPPRIRAAADDARTNLADADAALANKNAGAANTFMNSVDTAAGETSKNAIAWGDHVHSDVGQLSGDLAGYDRGALSDLKVALAPIAAMVPTQPAQAAGANATDSAITDAEQRLAQVDAAMRRYATARPYLEALAAEADEVAGGFDDHGFDASEVESAADALRKADAAGGPDPRVDVDHTGVAAAVRALIKKIRDMFKAVQGGSDPAVQELLQRGDLVGAANALLSHHRQRTPAGVGATTRLGGAAAAALTVARSTATIEQDERPTAVDVRARSLIVDRLRDLPGAATLALAGFMTELLHFAAAVSVVLLTGYALFLPEWTGTFTQFTQAVFWAFAIDVSITGLTALVTSRAPT